MGDILLVEDSEEYQTIVKRALSSHRVQCAMDVEKAQELLREQEFDLILLDINLPGKDGYSLLQEQQADPDRNEIPVICLTGNLAITDKVTAFNLGADDYVVKPFDPLELRARVEGRLNKSARLREHSQLITAGGLEIDQATHRVCIRNGTDKTEVDVTQTEFKLLCSLVRKMDRVFSRDQLLAAVWGRDATVLERAVDVHLCSLRKKLGPLGRAIQAVPGVGYKFSLPR